MLVLVPVGRFERCPPLPATRDTESSPSPRRDVPDPRASGLAFHRRDPPIVPARSGECRRQAAGGAAARSAACVEASAATPCALRVVWCLPCIFHVLHARSGTPCRQTRMSSEGGGGQNTHPTDQDTTPLRSVRRGDDRGSDAFSTDGRHQISPPLRPSPAPHQVPRRSRTILTLRLCDRNTPMDDLE